MLKKIAGSLWLWLLVASLGFCHLCNNIYRTPDRLIVKPEKQSTTVDGVEQVRVFVQNNYHTYVNNLRLTADTDDPALAISVTPESLRHLKAGERNTFTVRMKAGEGAAGGKHTLKLRISADNIGLRPVEEPTVEELRQVLGNPNGSPNVLAAESLAKMNDAAGSNYLKKVATSGGNRDYRARSVRALGKSGVKGHAIVLRSLLEEQDGFIKGNALLALGLLQENVETFRNQFDDSDEFVRTCAVAGMALAGDKTEKTLAWLRQAMQSPNVYIQIAASWALAAHRDLGAIKVLDQAFEGNPGDGTRVTMAGDAMVDIANRK